MPPPPVAKRDPAGEADGDSDGDAGREGQPRSSLGAAGGADRDREASGKTFDFERILEDFVLLTFLARPAIAAYSQLPYYLLGSWAAHSTTASKPRLWRFFPTASSRAATCAVPD